MRKIIFILFSFILLLVTGCSSTKSESSRLSAVLVIPSSEVQDTELIETKAALENEGILVTVASLEGLLVTGMLGGEFQPDCRISEIVEDEHNLIVCIGGNGSFSLWENEDVISILQDFNKDNKIVAAICAASGILANAGLLENKEATCYPYAPISDLLISKGAIYIDKEVVVSGRIITGNGPGPQLLLVLHWLRHC